MKLPQISASLYIGSVIYLFTLALEYIAVAVFTCPPGWTSYDYAATCFKTFPARKNWDEAKKVCHKEDEDLLNIWTGNWIQFYRDYTELRPDAYLIGLKRKKMCLVYNTSRLNTEHRIKCITQNKFICEIPAVCTVSTCGRNCSQVFSPFCNGPDNPCDRNNGYEGELCDSVCKENAYGSNCGGTNTPCDRISESCVFGCLDGHQGELCDPVCKENTYGPNCSQVCSPFCSGANNPCHRINGSCVFGCLDGYHGELCDSECKENTYGSNCSQGELCDSECKENTYGSNCSQVCSPFCGGANNSCNRINGSCVFGCLDGYHGELCGSEIKSATSWNWTPIYTTEAIISSIVFFMVVFLACVAMIPINRAMNEAKSSTRQKSSTECKEELVYFGHGYSDIINY
ncbi:hypothetical protein RRG08_051153 [Elysia crispata]|uniref:Uncharacterized protein n=1 Tax=Elysia crispata TaxID=231223 RepID=A0AAE1D198_9GAST|nr:hypothetical protein RRG08_051153 [Elysia crispata]